MSKTLKISDLQIIAADGGLKNSRSAGRRADRAKMAAKEFFFG
ncbi:hypothetical protein [Bradyrhizobium sp. WSM1743]|nr:hypothetical protein [Bradyrhizobium sp. WSM1743]